MREHLLEDSRMHYTILDAGGPSNIVPGRAKAEYMLRSYSTDYLENVIVPRFQDILKGACLMTGTTCEIERSYPFQAKIPCMTLNNLIMENAEEFKASQLAGPREKTGSTDFGNVMSDVPGCCIRTAFSRREPQHIPRNIWKPEKQRKHMRHFDTEQKFLPEPVWIFWNGLNFFQKSKRKQKEKDVSF